MHAALRSLSAAADAEDRTEKSIVTPGPLAPARELYGVMLLEQKMPREALAAFEMTLTKEPNRFNAVAGAARAAELLGDRRKARAYHEKLVALASSGHADRSELRAARHFLAN